LFFYFFTSQGGPGTPGEVGEPGPAGETVSRWLRMN